MPAYDIGTFWMGPVLRLSLRQAASLSPHLYCLLPAVFPRKLERERPGSTGRLRSAVHHLYHRALPIPHNIFLNPKPPTALEQVFLPLPLLVSLFLSTHCWLVLCQPNSRITSLSSRRRLSVALYPTLGKWGGRSISVPPHRHWSSRREHRLSRPTSPRWFASA